MPSLSSVKIGTQMAAIEVHKARKTWPRWFGTPSDIADLAASALAQMDGQHSEVRITVEARAWESFYVMPEPFRTGLKDDDLRDVLTVNVEATSSVVAVRKIVATFERLRQSLQKRTADPLPPVLTISVAGETREWVDNAFTTVSAIANRGVPGTEKFYRWMFLFSPFACGRGRFAYC